MVARAVAAALITAAVITAPVATAAVRATRVWSVKAEAPKAHGRAFQLTAEEVRATLDVVAGMYSLFIFYLS